MNEFFAMGGYAAYVWWAYGITAVVLTGLATLAITRARARRTELAELQARLGAGQDGTTQ